MPTSLLIALVGGLASGGLYASVTALGLAAAMLGNLAPLPLLLVGLSVGNTAVALACLVGTLVVLAVSASPIAALGFLAWAAVPAWFVVRLALRARPRLGDGSGGVEWYPPGRLLIGLCGLGIGGLLAAMAAAMGEPGGLEGVVHRAFQAVAAAVAAASGAPPPADGDVRVASALPGLMVATWVVVTVVNAALAQGALMRLGRNWRPPMRLDALTLPGWLVPAFAGAVAVAALATGEIGFLALNGAEILALPLAFAGLSVVHAFAGQRSAKTALLGGFYLCAVLFLWPILFLVGLGVMEQWIGLRRRLAGVGPDQED